MKISMKILSLSITLMMSTTMVFAQHTMSSARQDLNKVFTQLENVAEYQNLKSSNSCEQLDKSTMIKKINKRLAKARRTNESLEQSFKKEIRKYKRVKKRQIKLAKRILKKQRRINKYYKKSLKMNPELTKEKFVSELRSSISVGSTSRGIAALKNTLISSGSMENYLLNMKEGLLTCDKELMSDNSGIIYLIIFIGVPVLAIITALIALIAGGTTLALWSFIGAVAILIVFFLIGNLGDKLFILNKEEV